MERLFVYRTIPQTKFRFTSYPRNKDAKEQTYSQKCIRTQGDQKIVFKTKQNILMQNYVTEQNPKMSQKSKINKGLKRQMSQRTLRKTDIKTETLKFHQIPINDLKWQKWKHPQSIISANKRHLTYRSQKRVLTESDNRNKQQKQLEEIRRQSKQKQIERKIKQLQRFQRLLKDKKQVISIINNLYEQQNKVVKQTFSIFRKQMQQMCDFYASQKFDEIPLRRVKRPQLS